ncbi:MAG: AAA family ATPase [Dehalococcoidia bacterium]
MVPARLALRNFLCYREACAPLDFTGIHVACLTGENGNGKSALLDAITWALWGEARANTDDELIHLGRTEMEVEFEFYVGEQRYRVIRKRKKGTQRNSGATSLEFHIAAAEGWKALTANHIRDTERKVRDVIKLDYETFINSAFLIQGRADEFTLKAPGERKRILAEILGLSVYDELEEGARYEKKMRDDQLHILERESAEIERTLAQEPQYREEQQGIRLALEEVEQAVAQEAELLAGLRQAEHLLQLQRQQVQQAEVRGLEAKQEVEKAAALTARHRRDCERHETVVIHAPAIRAGAKRLEEARVLEQEYNRRQIALKDLERRRDRLENSVELARFALVSEEQSVTVTVAHLTAVAEPLQELERMRATIEERLAALQEEQVHAQGLRTEEQEQRDVISGLRADNLRLRDEMEAIKRKQTELSAATICPLCRTELGEEGQTHVLQAYQAEGAQRASQYRQNRALVEERQVQAKGLAAEVERLEQDLVGRRTTHARQMGTLERKLQEVDEAKGRLPECTERLQTLRDRLHGRDYAVEDAAKLASLTLEISAVDYDQNAHAEVRATIQSCSGFERQHQALVLAEARLESDRDTLHSAEVALAEWERRLAQRRAEVEELRAGLALVPDPASRLRAVEESYGQHQGRQRRLQLALGAVDQKLDDCARLRRQGELKTAALKQVLQERRIYEELMVAFSKRGIQALIIDHALPELTEEANRLLGRMTNNRLHLTMDTQRQTLKGKITETLDIRIADELGTRNYELFSGGEAFRVNLALRIALSKLLARRAGAPLPTLVIDEGFGSQDVAARERLIEAINVIQADFQCLLVITHLEELKDQFPIHIEVQKTPEGSIAYVTS